MNPPIVPPPQRTSQNRGVVYRSLALPIMSPPSQMDMPTERKYGNTLSNVGEPVTTSKGEVMWGSTTTTKVSPLTAMNNDVRSSCPPPSSGIVSDTSFAVRGGEELFKVEVSITQVLAQAQPVIQVKHVMDKWKWKCVSCSPQHVATSFEVRLYSPTVTASSHHDVCLVEFSRMSGDQYYFDSVFCAFREGMKSNGHLLQGKVCSQRTPRAFVPPPLPAEFLDDTPQEYCSNDCRVLQLNCCSNFVEIQTEAFQCLAGKLDSSSSVLGAVASSNDFLDVISVVACQSRDANIVRLACTCISILATAHVNAKNRFASNSSLRETLNAIANVDAKELIAMECKAKARDALNVIVV